MKDINLVIGTNIKELRKANKLTQYELAEKLNYSNKAISRWESGEVIPDVLTLNKFINKMYANDIKNLNKLALSLITSEDDEEVINNG